MTVTTTMIAQVSPFTVGDSGDFTETDFTQYKTWAALELDQIDPGFDTNTYDYCHALLICHYYESSRGSNTQYKSEKIGDYSYTRADSADPSSTSYYNRFVQVLGQWARDEAYEAVERDDADETFLSNSFKLDQLEKQIMYE